MKILKRALREGFGPSIHFARATLTTAVVLAVGLAARAAETGQHAFDASESRIPRLVVFGLEGAVSNRAKTRASIWLESHSSIELLISAGAEAGSSPHGNSETSAGEYLGKAHLWVRGNSSRVHPKKSYRLELTDGAGSGLKAALLGMPKESDWILYASYTDKTFLRDVLAHELWREMGHYAVRWRFVELYMVKPEQAPKPKEKSPSGAEMTFPFRFTNHLSLSPSQLRAAALKSAAARFEAEGPAMPEYEGLYILMEKIKRGKHRLDIQKLGRFPVLLGRAADESLADTTKTLGQGEESLSSPTPQSDLTGGYIFKKDRVNPGEHGFKTSQGMDFAFEEPKERDITAAQTQWLTNYVSEFERVLFGDNFADPVNGYARYIDVDSFIDYHWIVEATRNVDGYWFSQFYHKDRGGKLAMGPIWDWDISFGNCFYEEGYKTNGWRWGQIRGNHYKWFGRLFDDPDFVQKYIDRWAVLRTNVFATSNLLARIDDWSSQLEEAQQRNYQRWPTMGKAIHPNKFVGTNYQDEVQWLKDWITGRLAWIDSQGFPAPKITAQKLSGALSLAAEGGKIYYTLDGIDPRLPGGSISTNALQYQSPIQLARGQRVSARVRSAYALWSPPITYP